MTKEFAVVASTRWAARTARWLRSAGKPGQCSRTLAYGQAFLCRRAQALAAGQPGLDGGGLLPVAVNQQQRDAPAGRGGQRPDLQLGQG